MNVNNIIYFEENISSAFRGSQVQGNFGHLFLLFLPKGWRVKFKCWKKQTAQ